MVDGQSAVAVMLIQPAPADIAASIMLCHPCTYRLSVIAKTPHHRCDVVIPARCAELSLILPVLGTLTVTTRIVPAVSSFLWHRSEVRRIFGKGTRTPTTPAFCLHVVAVGSGVRCPSSLPSCLCCCRLRLAHHSLQKVRPTLWIIHQNQPRSAQSGPSPAWMDAGTVSVLPQRAQRPLAMAYAIPNPRACSVSAPIRMSTAARMRSVTGFDFQYHVFVPSMQPKFVYMDSLFGPDRYPIIRLLSGASSRKSFLRRSVTCVPSPRSTV